jgi:hypothetical protein
MYSMPDLANYAGRFKQRQDLKGCLPIAEALSGVQYRIAEVARGFHTLLEGSVFLRPDGTPACECTFTCQLWRPLS